MYNLVPVFVTYIIFYFCYQIITLFVRRRERLNIVEKMGVVNESLLNLNTLEDFSHSMPKKLNGMRLGFLLLGVGLGFMVGVLLTPQFEMALSRFNGNLYGTVEMCWIATSLMFGGLGLLISSIIESRSCKK